MMNHLNIARSFLSSYVDQSTSLPSPLDFTDGDDNRANDIDLDNADRNDGGDVTTTRDVPRETVDDDRTDEVFAATIHDNENGIEDGSISDGEGDQEIFVTNDNNPTKFDADADANADTNEQVKADTKSIISDEKEGPNENGDTEEKVAADIKPKGEDKREGLMADKKKLAKNKDENEVKVKADTPSPWDEEDITNENERVVLNPELRALRILNPTNDTLHPVFTTGCCGIGHRLSRILPTIVYANRHRRNVQIICPDVHWGSLFNDTEYVQTFRHDFRDSDRAKKLGLFFPNSSPTDWSGFHDRKPTNTHTILDKYRGIEHFLDNEHMFAILLSMRESLSPLVLSYLNPIREELTRKGKTGIDDDDAAHHVSVCAHVREGNGEKGDWEQKNRQMAHKEATLFGTLAKMKEFVESQNATSVSVYIASDNVRIRTWFRNYAPRQQQAQAGNDINWNVILPKKVMAKPESGVWFGEKGSGTSNVLNQTMKNEAMAEATAEVFALGECDALLIPTYSSFSYSGIVLTAGRKKHIYFGKEGTNGTFEMEEINTLLPNTTFGDFDVKYHYPTIRFVILTILLLLLLQKTKSIRLIMTPKSKQPKQQILQNLPRKVLGKEWKE